MKKLFATLLLGSMMAAAALAVSAEESGAVVLTPSTDGAQVSLNLPSDTTQDITTMRLSLTVTSTDPLDAKFVFDDAIESSVQEYRYDADSGRLNVYLSGRSTLFADGTLDLGQVQLTTRDGKPAQATLTAGEDAVQLMLAGASAVAVGTALFADPYAPLTVRDGLRDIAARKGLERVSQLTGGVKPW